MYNYSSRWIRIFQAYGDSAFDEKTVNESYTKEFKRKVVEAYLAGDGSLRGIAVKYKIPVCRTVLVWVKLYNDHIELKDKRGIRSDNKRMDKILQS